MLRTPPSPTAVTEAQNRVTTESHPVQHSTTPNTSSSSPYPSRARPTRAAGLTLESPHQSPPASPPSQHSAASITPTHTPILTPAHTPSPLPGSTDFASGQNNNVSTTNMAPTNPIPPLGHAPVSAASQAQALRAMSERPPPLPSNDSSLSRDDSSGSSSSSSSTSSRERRASPPFYAHRRYHHNNHGPMRTPMLRPHTPGSKTASHPSRSRNASTGPAATAAAYNQPTRAFVLERLHEYAPAALSNPRTSDVRIVVPSRPDSQRGSESATPTPGKPQDDGCTQQPQQRVDVRFYALHRDFLVPQSSLFRAVLTGGFKQGAPELKGCRLLPFTSLHGPRPVYVPLPDPDSFDVLVQWMYFGDVAKLEHQLSSGQVQWRGLIRNIQYLGLDERTRGVVARWWQRWAQAGRQEQAGGRGAAGGDGLGDDDDDAGDAPGDDEDSDHDDDDGSSEPKLPTSWHSEDDHLGYAVDTEEMSRRLGGL